MAQLVYTITGNNTGLATAVNNSIALIGKLQAAVDKLNGTSFEGLAASLDRITSSLNATSEGLTRTNSASNTLNQTVNNLTQTFNTTTQSVNTLNSNVNNLNQTFNNSAQSTNIAGRGLLGLASGYGILLASVAVIKKVVSSNAEISDSLADVRRTASLTAVETDNLFKSLEKIDTRTSLKGLIDISVIGGQLGIVKDQLAGFTRATDLLNVALGGEIKGGPEDIAKGLGILNNVFKISEKQGGDVEKAFNQIGSSILGLGQSGLATGDFLVNFGEKVGGVAAQAKLSLPILLSYGATLQEQGVRSEVAGTAFKKLLSSLGTKTSKFLAVAQIADSTLTLKEFTNLINTDTQAALELFFEGLKKGGPTTTTFLNLLKSVGLDAARSGQAISAIALNLDDLHAHIAQSTVDFNDGSKAAEQAALKNDTLGASVDRLSKAFVAATTSGAIGSFFKAIIDGITTSIKGLDTFAGSIHRLFTNNNNIGFLQNLTESEKTLQQIDDLQGAFRSSSSTKTSFLDKNPLSGNGELPTLKGQSRQELAAELHEIQIAYQNAFHAYSVYFEGIKNGVLTDSDQGIGRLSKVKKNAQDILYLYNKVKQTLDSLPVPKPGEGVTLPPTAKKGRNSGLSQEEFINRLQTFSDTTGASASQSGLSGIDLTLQKIEDKYKKHFDTLDALRIQLDKSTRISDSNRAKDEIAITDQENALNVNKAKEISDAKIAEATRVQNEIQRINDAFGVKAEQSRGRELALVQARYDAEIKKAKGNADILKAIDAGRLSAIQGVNDKYAEIVKNTQARITGIVEGAQDFLLDSESNRIGKIGQQYDKLKQEAAKAFADIRKTTLIPNSFVDAQQKQVNSVLDAAKFKAVSEELSKNFFNAFQSSISSLADSFLNSITTLGKTRADIDNKYAQQVKDEQASFTASQLAGDGKVSDAQNQAAIAQINQLKALELSTTVSFGAIFSSLVSGFQQTFNKSIFDSFTKSITENIGKTLIAPSASDLATANNSTLIQAAGTSFAASVVAAAQQFSGIVTTGSATSATALVTGGTVVETGITAGGNSAHTGLTKGGAALAAAASVLGGVVSGLGKPTNSATSALGGALSGAGEGALIGSAFAPVTGGTSVIVGAAIGGLVGLVGGLFSASKARKEQEAQLLEQAKQQTELLRQSVAYTTSIIGRMTNSGLVSDITVGATGQLVATVSGKQLQFVLDRNGR